MIKFNSNNMLIILLYLMVCSLRLYGEEMSSEDKEHSVILKTEFFQIKDEFNYGLVFNGVNIATGYSFFTIKENYTFIYSPELTLGVDFEKGLGVAWRFKPLDIFYGFNLKRDSEFPISAGAYIATSYNIQLYPELQSGHMFWFTSIEIGPQVVFTLPFRSRFFRITFSNSLAGLTSRPELATETYFYSLEFRDFIRNSHSNLKFGSFNLFNHTCFDIEQKRKRDKRVSIAYEFEYFGYYKEPVVYYINHSFNLKWKLGQL